MSLREETRTDQLLAERDRYVTRGIATPRIVVARADGARIEDVDGRTYIDFAGGIGCHNLGHGFDAAVDAIRTQLDRYLHQCFMVGIYEPYLEVCRRLAERSPCAGPSREAQKDHKSLLVNSGAEAVENAVKIARAATGRPGVIVFDHAFHGRTLLTLTMTSKLVYKRGFGPFAPDVYRSRGPYPYRGVGTQEAIDALELLFHQDVDPATVACVVLEPVQGEGGFIVMPEDFPRRLKELCARHGILYVDDEVQSGVGRTGTVWAIEHYGVEPDLLVSGKSLGGGLPLAAVTGRGELMDAVDPGGLGGTFGGNPLACAAAAAVLDRVGDDAFLAQSRKLGTRIRASLDAIAGRARGIGEVRGLGPMLALELVQDTESKRPDGERAKRVTARARELGLILLACGLEGNVIRILVPLVVEEEDLDRGMEILEEALVDSDASGG